MTKAKIKAGQQNGQSKIPLRRVNCDACAVYVGRTIKDGAVDNPGTPYYVHKGEWVDILPVMTVQEVIALMRLRDRGISGDSIPQMEQSFSTLCQELARRVVRWNWTDIMGEPIEQPWKHPDVLGGLTTDELFWLLGESMTTETAGERKNA